LNYVPTKLVEKYLGRPPVEVLLEVGSKKQNSTLCVSTVNINKKLALLFRPLFVKPFLNDLQTLRMFAASKALTNFLLPPPSYCFEFTHSLCELKLGVFYTKKILISFQTTLKITSLLYLYAWLIDRSSGLLAVFLVLLENESACLPQYYDTIKATAKASFVVKKHTTRQLSKPTKKSKIPFLNKTTPQIIQFLINLIKISSRGGAALRNFRHYVVFLRRLRGIGGYRRISQLMKVLNPFFYFRKRYRGRKSFYVPLVIMPEMRYKFIGRLLLKATINRKAERRFADRLIAEVVDALRRRGRAYKYKKSVLNLTNMHKFNIRRYRPRMRLLKRRIFY
jgi:ribosomal protein S7